MVGVLVDDVAHPGERLGALAVGADLLELALQVDDHVRIVVLPVPAQGLAKLHPAGREPFCRNACRQFPP